MPFVNVCTLSQLPPDSVIEVSVDGHPLALCHTAGRIRAIGGICPHHGGPLGQGAIDGEFVACPWHAWEFSSVTGESDFDPQLRVPTYTVRVEGDVVLVDFP